MTVLILLHYVYTTLPSEGQDYVLDQKEGERLM